MYKPFVDWPGVPTRSILDEGEFHSMTEWVDTFGLHADATTQPVHSLRSKTALGHDGMVTLPEDAAHAGEFLNAIDAYQPFDKDVNQLNKKTELLDRNNQGLVFIP